VAIAARAGFQQLMPSDSPVSAAAYFRVGTGHYFEAPSRHMISEGPVVTTWTLAPKDAGPVEENRQHFRVDVGVTNDLPLRSVCLMDGPTTVRRWLPGTNVFQARADFQHSRQYDLFVLAEDVKGRKVITSCVRTVPSRYHSRCADRQNWLGHVGHYYTGTRLPEDLDIIMPIQGTEEGNGMFPGAPGACMAGELNYPFTTPDVVLTEDSIRDVYVKALGKDVGYDAMPARASRPSTVYEALVRRYSFTPGKKSNYYPTLFEVEIRLKRDVVMRNTTNSFPAFSRGPAGTNCCVVRDGQLVFGVLPRKAVVDIQPGCAAGGFLALGPGLRLQNGQFGMIPPANTGGILASGTTFKARFLVSAAWRPANSPNMALDASLGAWVSAVGVAVPPPYAIKVSRGRAAGERTFPPTFAAKDGAIGGKITRTAELPFLLPLQIDGVSPTWPAGLWREDGSLAYAGVFEGRMWPRLDTSVAGSFYAGNLLIADNPDLVLEFVKWTRDTIKIEVHNPTDDAIAATISTPKEITTHKALKRRVVVPAGTTAYIEQK
jgi:hypothetical protein